jgi:hypothetical protein
MYYHQQYFTTEDITCQKVTHVNNQWFKDMILDNLIPRLSSHHAKMPEQIKEASFLCHLQIKKIRPYLTSLN